MLCAPSNCRRPFSYHTKMADFRVFSCFVRFLVKIISCHKLRKVYWICQVARVNKPQWVRAETCVQSMQFLIESEARKTGGNCQKNTITGHSVCSQQTAIPSILLSWAELTEYDSVQSGTLSKHVTRSFCGESALCERCLATNRDLL